MTRHIGLLGRPVGGSAEILGELLAIAETFDRAYRKVARAVAERARRTILCTIYEVQLDPSPVARLARVPLALLNDRIIRIGVEPGLDVLELRSVCTEPEDFVLRIEPSARGAEKKIARAISSAAVAVAAHSASRFFGHQQAPSPVPPGCIGA